MKKRMCILWVVITTIFLVGCNKAEEPNNFEAREELKRQMLEDEGETEDITEEEIEDELIFSDFTYNVGDDYFQVKVKNNTPYFIDTAEGNLVLDVQVMNGYGEIEIEQRVFSSYDSIGNGGIVNGDILICNHIESGEEESLTFQIRPEFVEMLSESEGVSGVRASSRINLLRIIYRGHEEDGNDRYIALDSEYEMEVTRDIDGKIDTVTITNISDYQWDMVEVVTLINTDNQGTSRWRHVVGQEIDKGSTLTYEFDNSSVGDDDIEYVIFRPRNTQR